MIFSILTVNFNKIILDTKTNDKIDKLVKIYYYVCEKFEEGLQYRCERFGNNKKPKLTDQEVLTIYLFVIEHQGIVKMNRIHQFAKDWLLDWLLDRFPDLGSYQAFNYRLNRISGVLGPFVEALVQEFVPQGCSYLFRGQDIYRRHFF